MNTPICDFLEKYASDDNIRLHMPGHKGIGAVERYDLTEIEGADSLYDANGIIKESENNASELFGSYTVYSAEGSSLSIRAMLYLATVGYKGEERALILAGRNAHKVFVSAAALLDFDVEWIVGEDNYLSCNPSDEELAARLDSMARRPRAVYITSPDYLGNMADIGALAKVCHDRGVMLLVDNAHGAYLAFTKPSMHPIPLGADMCADSAHKTLPCLTGGGYLHISNTVSDEIKSRAKTAMSLFGSTSPSYLILASLDKANAYIADGYKEKLAVFTSKLNALKTRLKSLGYEIVGNEPMKLTIATKSYGYEGRELAGRLALGGITPEFFDPDYLVLMPTPEIKDDELRRLESLLSSLPRGERITVKAPTITLPKRALTPREAVTSYAERIAVGEAEGRILADITVGCPPAIPIVVSGEVIGKDAIEAFLYYGIDHCIVVK